MEAEVQDLELQHDGAHHNERIRVRQSDPWYATVPRDRFACDLNWIHTVEEASRRGPQFRIHCRCTWLCEQIGQRHAIAYVATISSVEA
jgi:hypothetical protein